MNEIVLQEPRTRHTTALNQAQKAAIILCLLDKDGAAPLFEELGEVSMKNFVRVMAQIGIVDGETVRSVVAEFVAGLEQRGETVHCGARNALEIIGNNLGRAAAARISDSIDLFSEKNVWKRIAMLNPEVVSDFVSREHPQSAAVILTKLPPEYSGRVLSEIPQDQARQIAKYFRSMKAIGSKSTEIIGEALGGFLQSNGLNASALTPAARMGAIMNYASSQMREELIEHLDDLDPEFSEDVKRSMFTFADIEKRVMRNDVGKIVRAVDSEVLVKALAGGEGAVPSVRSFILANIATRMSEMIAQEIGDAGAVKRKESDKAQAEVIKAIVALESAGEIDLVTNDGE
jgi:flagellar motor switch protein FliG